MSQDTPSVPRFPFLLVDIEADLAAVTTDVLFELGAQGVEERDESTLLKNAQQGLVTLVAAFESQQAAQDALEQLDAELNPRIEEIVGDAWRDAWKEHFRPFAIAEGIVIRPPWETYEQKPGERVLELEPGRAFGTGLHETTKLVGRALVAGKAELQGQTLLDVGTGSGILALIALAFGAAHVVATDIDEDSVAVTNENAARNGMGSKVTASTTPIEEVTGTFPLVLANIEARVLIPLAPHIQARVAKGGRLLLSGILKGQESDVAAAYPELTLVSQPTLGEWVLLELRRA